jgi:thioredoxin-dependent peroxiredoxin
MERSGVVTMKGSPLTLVGPEIKPGDKAPDFVSIDGSFNSHKLSDTEGKVRLIASVPSLDTPVCSLETERFNKEAEQLPKDKVSVMVISMDLPFAQTRFCSMKGIENVKVYSDYLGAAFGNAWGTLIKENRLLARAVFVVDAKGVVRHAQYVPELTEHPDYDAALNAVKDLLSRPTMAA